MTQWHLDRQAAVPAERREVVIGSHRADILTASGGVVEIQHSSISAETITERERFYGEKMAWIFDGSQAFADGRLIVYPLHINVDHLWIEGFRWSWGQRAMGSCRRLVLVDLGDSRLLRLDPDPDGLPISDGCPIGAPDGRDGRGGWCRVLTRKSVEGWLRDGAPWERVRLRRREPPPLPLPGVPQPPCKGTRLYDAWRQEFGSRTC